MKNEVKEFFKSEASSLLDFGNFDEVYYYFEKVIEYEVAPSCIEGIADILPPAFEKIASEKIQKLDLSNCCYSIWLNFEPFVKKILHLTNPELFDAMSRNKKNSLVNYLEKMDIPVFIDEEDRDEENRIIFKAYSLKNSDSHTCQRLSTKQLYIDLSKSIAAYMIVTNRNIYKLKEAFSQTNIKPYKGFQLSNDTLLRIIERIEYKIAYPILDFENIVNFNILSSKSTDSDIELEYNDFNQLIKYNKYRTARTYGRDVYKTASISYNSDGTFSIELNKYARKQQSSYRREDGNIVMPEAKIEIKSTEVLLFDEEGKILSVSDEQGVERTYEYDKNNLVRKIIFRSSPEQQYKYEANNIYVYKMLPTSEEGIMIARFSLKEGRLSEMYTAKMKNKSESEGPPELFAEISYE